MTKERLYLGLRCKSYFYLLGIDSYICALGATAWFFKARWAWEPYIMVMSVTDV